MCPTIIISNVLRRTGDLSSAGRASALQAEGHRFEPYRSHMQKGGTHEVGGFLTAPRVPIAEGDSNARASMFCLGTVHSCKGTNTDFVGVAVSGFVPNPDIWRGGSTG